MSRLSSHFAWLVIAAVTVSVSGCGSPSNPLDRILALHKKGENDAAVALFMETTWSSDSIFAKTSVLAKTEAEFGKLTPDEMSKTTSDILPLLKSMRDIVKLVTDKGLDVGRTDKAAGKRYFDRATEFGSAIENSSSTKIVQLVGKGIKVAVATEQVKLAK